MSKQLIIINNKTIQQDARYNYLKVGSRPPLNCNINIKTFQKMLILQNFCPETLPRPIITKRKPRTQTVGLPKLFGGTLDQYYEATGEIIPLVVESCIKYINNFGMRHQGIFRIGGAHVSPATSIHISRHTCRLILPSSRRTSRRVVTPSLWWIMGITSTPWPASSRATSGNWRSLSSVKPTSTSSWISLVRQEISYKQHSNISFFQDTTQLPVKRRVWRL